MLYRITSFSRSACISSAVIPSLSPSTSSVCCPSSGGGVLASALLSANFIGVLTILMVPHAGCSISMTMFLSCVCGSSSAVLTSLMGAYGMPVPSKALSQSLVVLPRVISSMRASSSSRCATRWALEANLSSDFHSGRPMLSQRTPKRRSLPPPMRMSPSLVSKALYGTIDAAFRVSRGFPFVLGTSPTVGSSPAPGVGLVAYQAAARDVRKRGRLAVAKGHVDAVTATGSSSPNQRT